MSRHEIPGRTPELEVVVGWDNPLQTFFTQVLPPGDEDDDILLWLGTNWGEHPTPESLVAPLAPYARLDAGLVAELHLESGRGCRRGPLGAATAVPDPRQPPPAWVNTPRKKDDDHACSC
jgi:hypothetical protein